MQSVNLKIILKSIYAGIFIGLGACLYMMQPNVVGAFLFTIGLFGCINNKLYLFTGKVGWDKIEYPKILMLYLIVLLFNAVGIILFSSCIGFSSVFSSRILPAATNIVNVRLASDYVWLLFGSIGCGMLMSHAVDRPNRNPDAFNNILNYIPMMYCVPVFILCGFPHCVADLGYYTVYTIYNGLNYNLIPIWGTCILGNIIGCQIMGRFTRMLN